MAILRKSVPAPDDTPVPLAVDDPELQRLTGIRRALTDAAETRRRAIDLLMIERELQHPPAGSSTRGPRGDALRARAAALREALKREPTPAPMTDGLPASVTLALQIVAGEKVAEEPDRDAKLKRLRTEASTIEAALGAVNEMVAERKAERGYEIATGLVPQHQAALRRIYQAACALSEAVQAEREIVAGLVVAGWDANEHVLLRPGLGAASRLGSLDQHDSELSSFRRRLETWRLI